MTVSVLGNGTHSLPYRRLSRAALFNFDGVSNALFNSCEIIDICMLSKNQPKEKEFIGMNLDLT